MTLWKWSWVTATQFFGHFPSSSSLSLLLLNLEYSSLQWEQPHIQRVQVPVKKLETRYFMHHSNPRNSSYIFDLAHKLLTIHRPLPHHCFTQFSILCSLLPSKKSFNTFFYLSKMHQIVLRCFEQWKKVAVKNRLSARLLLYPWGKTRKGQKRGGSDL